ncbi:MAG: phospholipase effector Tle1 domain-containing protein, partial [Pseudonocardiaceae bacterium]
LWDPAPDQDVKQMWFPGSHLDVGGGHREKGLSDGALQWMIEQARETTGLAFHKTTLDQIRPDPLDVLHDDNRIFTGWLAPALNPLVEPFFAPRPRAVPLIDPPDPSLHESVTKRHQKFPITGGPYRTTRVLAAGESATVRVHARDPWNWTGLYLEPDAYSFTAQGQWVDHTIRSGPEGTTGPRRFLPTEGLRLLGTLFGRGKVLFRRVTRNPVADFLLTRREEDLPWMSLVGVVANDATEIERELKVHERIRIGAGTNYRVTKAGYLYAFANDAWSFYGNNRGSVQLTVTRKA